MDWLTQARCIQAIHTAFGLAFLVQMAVMIDQACNPTELSSSMRKVPLQQLAFPVAARVCLTPAFDLRRLEEVGYGSVYEYFMGVSTTLPLMGWGGLVQGAPFHANASGTISSNTLYHIFNACIF